MTQSMQPYRTNAPLTGGARFIRGFRRIGIVAGSLILAGGLITAGFIAVDAQNSANGRFLQASCVLGKSQRSEPIKTETYDANSVDLLATGCFGSRYSMTMNEARAYGIAKPAPMEMMIEPLYFGGLISTGCAILVFAFFYLIGWLCAGFTRD